MGIGQVPVNKTVGTPSVSGPSGPAKPAPSVEYSPNELGEGEVKTITDGKTEVTTSVGPGRTSTSIANRREGGGNDSSNDDIARGAREAYFQKEGKWPPCINTSCRSYGRPHKNCLCFGNHSDAGRFGQEYAKGGEVCSNNQGHHPNCEHFEHPAETLGNAVVHHGLHHALTKSGHSKSENPDKPTHDHKEASLKGAKTLHGHLENLFTTNKVSYDKSHTESLKTHLHDLRENPDKLFDVSGNLSGEHASQLGALAGTTVSHFNAIKPNSHKTHPLDELTSPDKRESHTYDRHLSLAQNPSLLFNHVKDGTLLPSDISTIEALYPTMLKHIKDNAFEALVGAKERGIEIPYKMKQSLGLLLGQDLATTMTPQSMQAIIKSQGAQQVQNTKRNQPTKKASNVELKQINKVNENTALPLQKRQMGK